MALAQAHSRFEDRTHQQVRQRYDDMVAVLTDLDDMDEAAIED